MGASKVVIALTGFDDKQGDRQTLISMIEAVVQLNKTRELLVSDTAAAAADEQGALPSSSSSSSSRKRKASSSRSSGGGSGDIGGGGMIPRYESSVSVLSNYDDYSAESCTHVIVPGLEYGDDAPSSSSSKATRVAAVPGVGAGNRTRTLRVLFAVARGQWVLSESFLLQSVSEERWADCTEHRHSRYRHLPLGRPLDLLQGKTLCIARSTSPPADKLAELVAALGGSVKSGLEEEVDFVLFGEWRRQR